MKDIRKSGIAMLAAGALTVCGQTNLLPNGGFEVGEKLPAGWTLSNAACGAWLKAGGIDDSACLRVMGNGTNSCSWESLPVDFLPNRLYRLSFNVRGEEAGGCTVVSGPSFANVDIGVPGKEWTHCENVFVTPQRKELLSSPVRLGQWELKGRAFFDNVRLAQVQAVHSACGEGTLGEGEKLEGNVYSFDAPFAGESRNFSRPLLGFSAHYNTDRWCFGEGSVVTYRHELAGRKLLSGSVEVNSGYFVSGRLIVDVSADAKEWQHVGVLTNTGNTQVALPAALFPAEAVYVRLRGARPPCSLQVHGYKFEAAVDGTPAAITGSTRYLESESYRPKIRVQVRGLGAAQPGGVNVVDLRVQNATGAPFTTEARVLFARPGETTRTNEVAVEIPGTGAFDVSIPYEIPGVGTWQMAVSLGNAFTARSAVRVPEFYDDTYGELIPVNNPKLNLWRASSGWKIPQYRMPPRQIAKSLVLRVAKNEREALQLVVAPNAVLTNVAVSVSDLSCGKDKIPSGLVDILRVGYVPVAKRTDATGTLADWPDPLLPQDASIIVEAGHNQPYWIRVKAPKDLPAGIYRGTVTVTALDLKVSTVLNVEVYDFALPDTMTCQTSFGFSPSTVWRYHKVNTPDQRREVLDKYLRSLGEHHISPYNPAPMNGWKVEWKGMSPWRGGSVVTNEKAEGKGALLVRDTSELQNVGASYAQAVPLPAKGVTIRFKHKTDKPQKFLVSLNYLKANGDWMPGCNTDIAVAGQPQWQTCETVQSVFPKEAVSCRLTVWAAGYQEPGASTGSLWLDALTVTDAGTGKELVDGGAFEPVDPNAIEPVFAWEDWDAAMERAFATYHFNAFVMRIDGLGGGTFQSRYEPNFMGYRESDPEYDVFFGKYLKGIEAHLRDKGWLDKAYVYWFDEPDPKDYAFVMNGFAKLKKHAPALRRMLTEQIETELVGGPNLWCPLTPSLNVAGLEERRTAGDQFWWYVCCGPKAPYATEFIDHPGTEMRVWLWQTWAERVTGILIWETVWWTSGTAFPDAACPQNPYADAMSWVSDATLSPGTRQPWGNGDGRFLYPPLAAADGRPAAPVLDGPVDSYRLELLRDGIEDYEYFVILKRLLSEKSRQLDPRTRQNMEALLTVPADVSSSLTSFTRDPATIETHRDKLARAIIDLQKR